MKTNKQIFKNPVLYTLMGSLPSSPRVSPGQERRWRGVWHQVWPLNQGCWGIASIRTMLAHRRLGAKSGPGIHTQCFPLGVRTLSLPTPPLARPEGESEVWDECCGSWAPLWVPGCGRCAAWRGKQGQESQVLLGCVCTPAGRGKASGTSKAFPVAIFNEATL